MSSSAGEAFPAYLVKGDDPVLRDQAVRAIVHELVGDGDATLMVEEHEPESDGADATALIAAARTPPFLSERRVVVAREVSTYSSDALGPVLAYLDDPEPTTSLVLVAGGKGTLNRNLTPAVRKVGHVVETAVPATRKGRTAWLTQHLEGAPVRLERPAVELVDRHLGEDLGRLHNLLDALAAAYGRGARVAADDVAPFLGEEGAVPPWELTDAIDRGDAAGALSALHRMTGPGERHPLAVLSVLHSHVARMLRLQGSGISDEATAAEALGLKSTFPARKALSQARRLGGPGVAEAVTLLAQADLDLRGAKGWPEDMVLDVLVARLARLSGRSR